MSNPEVMNSNLVSYGLAVDLAYLANDAHSAMVEVAAVVDAAQRVSKCGISGVALGAGSLAVLAERYRIATNDFTYLENSVPNFRAGVLNLSVEQVATDPETLTPEEQAYKEIAIELLVASHDSYSGYMGAIKKGKRNKLPVATSEEARLAAEAVLTPAMIRAEMAQIAEFTANPIENSPEAGFDTVFIPNANLTDRNETVLANNLQGKLQAYKGSDGAYVYPALHNSDTAHTATSADANVVAVRVPRHLNVAKGAGTSEVTAVQDQANQVNAHNNDPNTSYKLEMASDMVALAHIALLIDTQAIDTTNPKYDAKRFWATYYKNVLQAPVGGCVSSVCVDGRGQVFRGRSNVNFDAPSRALVVPKLES